MTTTQQETLIGTSEAARLLGCSQRTVQRMVESGELSPVVVAPGGAYVLARSHVERLVETASP